jgi:hypothetical protein
MIRKTPYSIFKKLLTDSLSSIPAIDYRLSINQPTGDFFYDRWEIKPEFKDTVWEEILNTLPFDKGEARLIKLVPGGCYMSHADIDDRWHLSLTGNQSFLIDLDDQVMHRLDIDGYWYDMNAGKTHTAANFGDIDRVQLVVRHLLTNSNITGVKKVTIALDTAQHDYRYQFDKFISPWLNGGCKQGFVNNFSVDQNIVTFDLHEQFVQELVRISQDKFNITISDI